MGLVKDLERIEQSEQAKKLREAPHVLHPAGGLTDNLVCEPVTVGEYVYKTKEGKKGIVRLQVEFEDQENRKGAHWFIDVNGERVFFTEKPPKEFLFDMPEKNVVEKWVKGEKPSQTTQQLWCLNAVYLRTFLDFPHAFEFSVVQLFIQQSWLTELLPVVFYLGIKGEFGGGKSVTGEAIAYICKHGYLTGNLSLPFVARSIQDQKLTLMVDELDSIAKTKDSDLNSIFRQGYRRGIKYSRVNPDTLEVESYLIFGGKLFTVHSDVEEALQTRTVPVHVRETSNPEFPIVNLDKTAFAHQVYTENFLWYLDNILTFRDNDMHLVNGSALFEVDLVDIVDPSASTTNVEEQASKIRLTLFEKKRTLVTEGQLSQLCQLTGRNIELMFMCFTLSNLTRTVCDDDIVKTFQQKLVEEGERTELGYIGLLREVLSALWKEKQTLPEYKTEAGQIKISNKEVYDTYNLTLKKEYGEGISPAKFKEYMLEFGFTDALNRTKLKVPIPTDAEPKSRLCNIFTDRVLRKIGLEEPSETKPKIPIREELETKLRAAFSKGTQQVFEKLVRELGSLTDVEAESLFSLLRDEGKIALTPEGWWAWT